MAIQQNDRRDDQPREEIHSGRRRALMTGAIVLPTILTLHAAPAWATTDYTATAYRYGANAGLCRNPSYNPNANPNSTAGQEFIECPSGQQPPGRHRFHSDGDNEGQTDNSDFQIR